MSAASLKVKTTARPGSRMAVEVAVPAERCKESYEAAVSRLSRTINLPGFRKGKVPRAVLMQQIGPMRIRATALESMVDGVWREAIEQEKIEAPCGVRSGFKEQKKSGHRGRTWRQLIGSGMTAQISCWWWRSRDRPPCRAHRCRDLRFPPVPSRGCHQRWLR